MFYRAKKSSKAVWAKGLALAFAAGAGAVWAGYHRYLFPESIFSSSYAMQINLGALCVVFIGWCFDCTDTAVKVTSHGIEAGLHKYVAWGNISRIIFCSGWLVQQIKLENPKGLSIWIPWPLDNPQEFEKLCQEYADSEHPLNVFLKACSEEQKRDGGAPEEYFHTKASSG
jgi:hypothetical protein